jgi:tetratricopeptide (TPR) repeat protein
MKADPTTYLPNIAMVQRDLGIIYTDTDRYKEAEERYLETLDIRRNLAKEKPEAYLPRVAVSQSDLGRLYAGTGRYKEEQLFLVALDIRRNLAKEKPEAYLPLVAVNQSDLGSLYADTGRYKEAEGLYLEALNIYQSISEGNREKYSNNHDFTKRHLEQLYEKMGKNEPEKS